MANEDGVRMCDVAGCSKEAERSVSPKKMKGTSISLKNKDSKTAHLCKEHYASFKKETKTDRKLERLGY